MKKVIMAMTLSLLGLITGVEARCVHKDPEYCCKKYGGSYCRLMVASSHDHHPKHNMIMMGESEVFLSHIVYKVPHNYQVLLKIHLPNLALETYLEAKKNLPKNQMIFLLDSMDMSQIISADTLKGIIYSENGEGMRTEILSDVVIPRNNFEILFFNELPTQLDRVI